MNGTRTRLIAALTAVALAAAASACTGSAMTDPPAGGELTIGFLAPQSGPLSAIGKDMLQGWQLYLDQHGGRLGGHKIKLVVGDEGDGGATARASVDKLIKSDHAVAIVGAATAPAVMTAAGPTLEAKTPLVGVGGRPSTLSDVSYVWHTSFASTDYGQAIAAHVRASVDGPVYVIGPDYQGGRDQIGGFVKAFTDAGGKLANPGGQPTYTPYPATTNFGPWLSKVRDSGAKAVYAFYAGAPAIGFVKQYQEFGLHGSLPLYGPAFVTEGAALAAEGAAADGIFTVANYAPGLDNSANKAFAAALTAASKASPNVYHLTSFDAAALLDQAIAATASNPTPEAINTAIGKLTTIDSPRGSWHFNSSTHTPIQSWYLRQVVTTGDQRTNTVVKVLTTTGS